MTVMITIEAEFNRTYNCEKCLSRYNGRADQSVMQSKVEQTMGCKGVSRVEHRTGMLRGSTCFGKFAIENFNDWIEMAMRYKKGLLPIGSTLDEIPARVVYLLKFIDNVLSEKLNKES